MESIAVAAEFGFDFVELMMDGDAHRTALEAESEAVAASVAERDIDLLVHFPYPILIGSPHNHQRAGAVEELKHCIQVAVDVGAEKGVVHPDSYGWSRVWEDKEKASLVAESVRELHDFAREYGFEICVENLFGDASLSLNEFDILIENTDASMTFDTGHAAIVGLDEPEMATFLANNRDRVSHVHLNDTRHQDAGYVGADEHLPLGYGALDFETILDPLLTRKWNGTLSIELDTDEFDYLRTNQQYLERIVKNL